MQSFGVTSESDPPEMLHVCDVFTLDDMDPQWNGLLRCAKQSPVESSSSVRLRVTGATVENPPQ